MSYMAYAFLVEKIENLQNPKSVRIYLIHFWDFSKLKMTLLLGCVKI